MVRFGLGHDDVGTVNPRVIYCSISGFGAGQGATLPGYGPAGAGTVRPHEPHRRARRTALRAGVAVVDVMTGLHAATGILAALHHRDVTGRASTSRPTCCRRRCRRWSTRPPPTWPAGGADRMGNEHLSLYPYEPMATGDGELIIAVATTASSAGWPPPSARRNWPTTRASRPWPCATRTAASCGRCCWPAGRESRPRSGSASSPRPTSVRSDQRRRRGRRPGRGARARPGGHRRRRADRAQSPDAVGHPAALRPGAAGPGPARRGDPGLA